MFTKMLKKIDEKIKNTCANPIFQAGILVVIILLGFFLRIFRFYKPQGFWLDEAYCFYEAKASFPFGILSKLYHDDIHAPLYVFILHFWMKLWGHLGEHDWVIRLLSIIFGILTIPVIYLV